MGRNNRSLETCFQQVLFDFSLDKLIDSIEFLSDDLKGGRDVKMSQSEVLKKSGEIFALRHVVNLSSDLVS